MKRTSFFHFGSTNWTAAPCYAPVWADYDNDGFVDRVVSQTGGKNTLYHNPGNTDHWIKFQLQGVVANRFAIGTQVRVKAIINGKTYWQMREVPEDNYRWQFNGKDLAGQTDSTLTLENIHARVKEG